MIRYVEVSRMRKNCADELQNYVESDDNDIAMDGDDDGEGDFEDQE